MDPYDYDSRAPWISEEPFRDIFDEIDDEYDRYKHDGFC